jgi:hypothetical protein
VIAQQVSAHRSDEPVQQQLRLLASSSSSSSSSRLNKQLRRLQQQRAAAAGKLVDVPQCLWNDVREVCAASQLSYLSVNSPPVTLFHRYDRFQVHFVCFGVALPIYFLFLICRTLQ